MWERFSPLTRAATVVDLPEARMSDGRGRGGSTRRFHYRALCASNDPRTEAQRSASTAKATRRRSPQRLPHRTCPSVHKPVGYRSSYEKRWGQSPWVIRAHQAAAIRGNSAQSRTRADLAFDLLWAGYGLWAG